MPKIDLPSLKQILQKNVGVIRFSTRRSRTPVRTMLCTLDMDILNSVNGRITFNFKPPVNPPKYRPEPKNLLLVWDILMQDWRMVSMDDCEIVQTIAEDDFWEYFNKNIYKMTLLDKMQFMGK